MRKLELDKIRIPAIIIFIMMASAYFFFDVNPFVILFSIASVALNMILRKVQLSKNLPVNFQLTTFSVVLLTLATDIKIGMLMSVIFKFAADIYAKDFFIDHLPEIVVFWISCTLAYYLDIGFIALSLCISILDSLLIHIVRKSVGIPAGQNIMLTVSRFLFNVTLFFGFGEMMMMLMTI